jgi:hypothetical protein
MIVTVACAVAALAVGAFALRLWKRVRAQSTSGAQLDAFQTREFLTLSGVMLAPLFAGTIVLAGISPLFLSMCS